MTTHATGRGKNTTRVTKTGMKALMPKPIQPQMSRVFSVAALSMSVPSRGTPSPITTAATTVKPSICTPYLTIVIDALFALGTPSLYRW